MTEFFCYQAFFSTLLGEGEQLWDCLAFAEAETQWWAAAYYVICFASERDKFRFLLHPAERNELVQQALLRGGVQADGSYFVELNV